MSEIIVSNFEAARSAHFALTAAAVALLLVSGLPSERTKYVAAKQELDALYEVVSGPIDDLYAAARAKATATLAKQRTAVTKAARAANVRIDTDIEPVNWIPWKHETPGDDLAAAATFFSRSILLVFTPDEQALDEGLSKSFAAVAGPEVALVAIGTAPFDDLAADTDSVGINLEFATGQGIRVESFDLPGKVDRLDDPDAREWLRSHAPAVPLVSIVEKNELVFPSLQAIWSEVRAKDIDSATDLVNERIASAGRTVSIFGLSLEEELISIAAPFLLLVATAYVALHLRHLSSLSGLNPKEFVSVAQRFPWPALYSERMAMILVVASIVVLPLATSIWVIVRFAAVSTLQLGAGVSCALGVLFFATRAFVELRRIRAFVEACRYLSDTATAP